MRERGRIRWRNSPRKREEKKFSKIQAVEEKLTQGSPRKGDRMVRALGAEHGDSLSKGAQTAPQQREREKASLHPHIPGAREKSQISSDIRLLRDKSEFRKTMA